MQIFTSSMDHAQRTPLSEHNIVKAQYFSSPSDLMKSSCGWMKASLISTNVPFKRVYQLLLNKVVYIMVPHYSANSSHKIYYYTFYFPCYNHICTNNKYALKCNRYATYIQLVNVHISDNYISIYTSYQLNKSTISPQVTVYICFTLMTNMPATSHVCPTAYKLHIAGYKSRPSKLVCCKPSSNMHIYYLFGNHIYSLSSMVTYVFLLWQTYFAFCIYANNCENFTHTSV